MYNMEIISQIKKWLDEEVEYHQPVVNGKVVLSDGTSDICIGRYECALGLLSHIKQLEEYQRQKNSKL